MTKVAPRRAASSTVAALVYALQSKGRAALPWARRHLADCSDDQVKHIIAQLARLRGTDDELVLALAELVE